MANSTHPGMAGMGVDAGGGPVIDPTANVVALNEAANQRQDDLRHAQDRLATAERAHLEAIVQLRAEHAREIRQLESDRLDKIRQVDVLAVSTAADRAQAAIQALASVTASNAENLRNALTATATTIATQLANTVAAINERIATLEKTSYTGQGKQAVADPQLADLVAEMRKLSSTRDVGSGKSEGISTAWMILLGAVGLIVSLITIATVAVTVIVFLSNRPVVPAPATVPQVIYTPAPPGTQLPSTPPERVPR